MFRANSQILCVAGGGATEMMNFAFKMMKFALKLMKFALQMMDFVFKMMNLALKMMYFVFKMMNSVCKNAGGGGAEVPRLGHSGGRVSPRQVRLNLKLFDRNGSVLGSFWFRFRAFLANLWVRNKSICTEKSSTDFWSNSRARHQARTELEVLFV